MYGCVNKHKVLAHDEVILQCFTQQYLVPFVLFHRTGFTRDLADTCMALVRRGVNFHNMETIVLERRWETFSMQKAFDQHSSSNYHTTAIDQNFFSSELAKSPSDSLLTKCFLATFLKEEQVYLTEIVSTTCRSKNCANPHGKKEVLLAKRKRTPHSMQIPLPNSKRFAMDRGESVMPGAWSEFEFCWKFSAFKKKRTESLLQSSIMMFYTTLPPSFV